MILKNIEKEELISAITNTIADHVLNLMSTSEAADLLQVDVATISKWKKIGLLTDYSHQNEHRKFSASEVLSLRRMDSKERKMYARKKQLSWK